jgi:hypothetical protein
MQRVSEKSWAEESVTLDDEGKSLSPEQILLLSEEARRKRPLDVLPVKDRVFYRVGYGLDLTWDDLQCLSEVTGRPPAQVGEELGRMYRRNTHRRVNPDKLMEKRARAYSYITDLSKEEEALVKKAEELRHRCPVNHREVEGTAAELDRVRQRIDKQRALQLNWAEEVMKAERMPSKAVGALFGLRQAAVDQRMKRIRLKLAALREGTRR